MLWKMQNEGEKSENTSLDGGKHIIEHLID